MYSFDQRDARRLSLVTALVSVALVGGERSASAHVNVVTDSAKLRGNDFLSLRGGNVRPVGTGGSRALQSTRGVGVDVQEISPTKKLITLDRTVNAAGTYIQASDPSKPLRATVRAYDSNGKLLKLFSASNVGPRMQWSTVATRDGRAFIGVKSCHAVIKQLAIETSQPSIVPRMNIYAKGLAAAPPRPALARRPLPARPAVAVVPPVVLPPVAVAPPIAVPPVVVPPVIVPPPVAVAPPVPIPPIPPTSSGPGFPWAVPAILLASALLPGGGGSDVPSFPVTPVPPITPPTTPPLTPPTSPPPVIPPTIPPPTDVPVVPEPTALALLLPGLIPLVVMLRKRKSDAIS